MKSFIAALRNLVLPYGRTSGQRIVLDGDNGQIAVYDASDNLAVLIQSASPAGITVYGPDGSINLADSVATWESDDGSVLAIGTGGGVRQEFTPQDVGNAWTTAKINTVLGASDRGGFNISSPADSVNTETASLTLFGGGPSTNDSSVLVSADFASFSGAVYAENVQTGSFAIVPTTSGQWTANAVINFPVAFRNTPTVMVTPSGNGPGTGSTTDLQWQVTGVTTTGFNCRILRGNLTSTTLSWLAVDTL